jgi:hypothetical protein
VLVATGLHLRVRGASAAIIGVVGALLAPAWAALGAVAAEVSDCSIEVERAEPTSAPGDASRSKPEQEQPSHEAVFLGANSTED